MRFTWCVVCGSVVCLDQLIANDTNNTGFLGVHEVDGKFWFQCRSCAKRNEVKDENISTTLERETIVAPISHSSR